MGTNLFSAPPPPLGSCGPFVQTVECIASVCISSCIGYCLFICQSLDLLSPPPPPPLLSVPLWKTRPRFTARSLNRARSTLQYLMSSGLFIDITRLRFMPYIRLCHPSSVTSLISPHRASFILDIVGISASPPICPCKYICLSPSSDSCCQSRALRFRILPFPPSSLLVSCCLLSCDAHCFVYKQLLVPNVLGPSQEAAHWTCACSL